MRRSELLTFAFLLLIGGTNFHLTSGSTSDFDEYSVTLKTEKLVCNTQRGAQLITPPPIKEFAVFRTSGSREPCMLAKMGVQVKIDFVTLEDEELTTIINVPKDANVTGSCDAPQWMKITWMGKHGKLRSIYVKANDKSMQKEAENHFIEHVELRTEIDYASFPDSMHIGELLNASATSQQLFEAPVNKSFKCKDVTVNLEKHSPMRTVKLSFQNIQFQTYSASTFGEGVNCDAAKTTDYVAIGIGCFLAATILSAIVSYTFCQWWRRRGTVTQ